MKSSVKKVYEELGARGIEVKPITLSDNGTLLMFNYNQKWRFISGVSPDLTPATARTICNDKLATRYIADALSIRAPATEEYSTDSAAEDFLRRYKTVVVKPRDGAHGLGVATGITSLQGLYSSLESVKRFSTLPPLLQEQVSGEDLRVLVIDGTVAAAAQRVPARVTGDGIRTTLGLIEHENASNEDRGVNYERRLNKIDLDAAKTFLGQAINEIPANKKTVTVVGAANIGTGGEAIDVTKTIPSQITSVAEGIAESIGAFTVGVDFLHDKESDDWYLIELNSSPSFGLHLSPSEGDPVAVDKIFVDALLARYDSEK